MTPEEQSIVDQKLKEVAEILYNNTPETIELSVRDHLLKRVAPKIGEFFSIQQQEQVREEREQ
jgi:hypothetical protein